MNLSRTSRPACPFVAGPKIDDPRCFVGREEELRTLAARMSGAQPISVNVVGERRIGKSSLLWQFTQTWAQRVDEPARYAVVFVDLQSNDPPTEDAFFQLLAKTLLTRPTLRQDSLLVAMLSVEPFTRIDFAAALDLLSNHGLLPVFCLNEFEMLLKKRPEQFGDSFFDHLRGFMDASRLMLIISSRKPLDVYANEQKLTSAFFNLGQIEILHEFTDEEAEELLFLPSPLAPALNLEERRLARKWGGRHPYLLQLAALKLFDARQTDKDKDWAKQQFERERDRRLQVPEQKPSWSVKPWLRAVFLTFPGWLGSLVPWIGKTVGDIANFVVGWAIILLLLACVFKYTPAAALFAYVQSKIKP